MLVGKEDGSVGLEKLVDDYHENGLLKLNGSCASKFYEASGDPLIRKSMAEPDIIDLWTTEFLKDFRDYHPRRPKSAGHETSKPFVAFGRTTHDDDYCNKSGTIVNNIVQPTRAQTAPVRLIVKRGSMMTLRQPTKLSDSRIQQTTEYLSRLTEQQSQSKVRGSQMLNFKIDLSKAREKRTRQLQYSNEIRSGTASSQGGKEKLALEIDSVTRLVVQSFRKLIDCERCALFLLDDKTNELYFKPVGDGANSLARLKEIRFPASSGVAGWCASNKLMLNIKNAYHDARFNTDVDKKTGFKTRTILCHPVLSSNNQVLGVVQMVNKKKTQQKAHELVKKKGYDSMYEHFSAKDEEILGKCCAEVSKSLELIYSKHGDRKQQTPEMTNRQSSDEKENHVVVFSDDSVESSLISDCDARSHDPVKSETDSTSYRNSVEKSADDTDSASFRPEKPTSRDISKRRSSVGELAQFIRQAASETNDEKADNKDITPTRRRSSVVETAGITEAVQKFRFRAPDMNVLRQREMERRLSDTGFQVAETKRKRMQEYGEGVRSMENGVQSIEAATSYDLLPQAHVTASVAQLTPFIQQPGSSPPAIKKAEVDRSRRRSSVADTAGIAEAVQQFQLRAPDMDVLRRREMERRRSDTGYIIADAKRKVMQEYGEKIRLMENGNDI